MNKFYPLFLATTYTLFMIVFSPALLANNTHTATGVRISSGGTDTNVNSTTEAWSIYDAWIADGSPASGSISNGLYNVAESGIDEVDRIDFGGSNANDSGTLPYPGFGVVGNGGLSDFLVHTTGTIHLPAGDYTLFVQSDDGFSLELETLLGDTVSFNKFGRSTAGESNQLLFNGPTGNSRTGGSFTLSEASVFTLTTMFFERGGGDFMEVAISNTIQNSTSASNYEVLKHGALEGAVIFNAFAPESEPEPELVARYRFDQNSFGDELQNILDSSGNDLHGSIISNSIQRYASPALSGDPGTCGYVSQQYGSIEIDDLPLSTVQGEKTTVTFWMNWDGTTNTMPLGWNGHDIWLYGGSIGFNTWSNDIYGTSSTGLANTWVHIAVEFTNGDVGANRMHINGVEQSLSQQRYNSYNNNNAYVGSDLRIGGVVNSSYYKFYGLLDEVQVYQGALSTEKVNEIMAQRQDCPDTPVVHHYEIEHDGQALTCEAETVTVKACTNADCSLLSDQSVTVELFGNASTFGSSSFIGSSAITHQYTSAETLSLSLANLSAPPENSLICKNGSSTSCDIVFSAAGFRFLSGAANILTIPDQIAGAAFSDTLKVQAVKDDSGVCAGVFISSVSVNLSQENVDPGGTSGLSFNAASNTIAKHTSSTAITLNFDSNSIAEIPSPIYYDAGQIRLHANYDVNGALLNGTSNSFWVSPAALVTSVKSGSLDINGASPTAGVIHPAGDDFELTVTAMNAATPAAVTPNYSPGRMQMKLTRTAPTLADSTDGSLQYNGARTLSSSANATFQDVDLVDFNAGVSSYAAAKYSEVGLINIDVQDSNYGNSNILIPSSAIDVGRFVPKYFEQTVVENGVLMATCNSSISFTAYNGQLDVSQSNVGAISYSTSPVFAITAYNAQGNITENYYQDSQGSINDFMHLDASNIVTTTPTNDKAARGVDSQLLPITANMSTGILSQNDLTALSSSTPLPRGTLHYKLADTDNFFYIRSSNALVNPFISDFDFNISSIIDSDNIVANSTVAASPTGVNIRFGRLRLENSFGPETNDLSQVMQIEHFEDGAFRLSNDEACHSSNANRISLTNISLDPALSTVNGGAGSFVSGTSNHIYYSSPGDGNQGQMGVSYDAYDWLKYDWNNDGTYDEDPSAIISFGLYKGDDRLLHWREVY